MSLAKIEQYKVTDPPTYEGVVRLARMALVAGSTEITIELLPTRQVPAAEPELVTFFIDADTLLEPTPDSLHGMTSDSRSVRINNTQSEGHMQALIVVSQ